MSSKPILISPGWLAADFEQIVVAQSTRHGGQSLAPYASLNLGIHTNDSPENVTANRLSFCQQLGILPEHLAGAHQVHGCEILRAHRPGYHNGFDALITNKTNVFLSISVADCVPVLLYDSRRQAVGAAHAGWRGTVAEITAKTLLAMRDAYGTQPKHCLAYIGCAVAQEDYEVSNDVAEQFEEDVKWKNPVTGKYHIDLKKANKLQLTHLGVPEAQIDVSPYSTVADVADFFSHRAENGVTGRMMAVIGMRK